VIALQHCVGFVTFRFCVFVAFIGSGPLLHRGITRGSNREFIPIYRQFLYLVVNCQLTCRCSEWSVPSFHYADRNFVHLINVPPAPSPFVCCQLSRTLPGCQVLAIIRWRRIIVGTWLEIRCMSSLCAKHL
jgi:hypothetical protein